jgi:hypothetical protein
LAGVKHALGGLVLERAVDGKERGEHGIHDQPPKIRWHDFLVHI